MISPGLQVDSGKEREQKIYSERKNVSIQSFSISEAEELVETAMKLNQTHTYRRGDNQLLCVFTAYSVLIQNTFSRWDSNTELNEKSLSGQGSQSSAVFEANRKAETYSSHQQGIFPYTHHPALFSGKKWLSC